MEFLKILGEELFNQVVAKINEHNGNEANKDNQIKLANLATGEYVGKGKYDDLNTQLQGKITELDTANSLIADLKKGNKNNEDLQGKITAYEGQIEQLQAENAEIKLSSAIKFALQEAKVVDVDYMTFKLQEKLKEKGETLELDENDKLKNWEAQLEGLKTQFPTMFEAAGDGGDGYEPYDPAKLPKPSGQTVTKEQFRAMSYEERLKLKQSNETLFNQLAN